MTLVQGMLLYAATVAATTAVVARFFWAARRPRDVVIHVHRTASPLFVSRIEPDGQIVVEGVVRSADARRVVRH